MADVAAVAGGILLIAIALVDVFQSVIVPRTEDTPVRASRYLVRLLWRIWPPLATPMARRSESKREDFLGTFAPFALVTLLVTWVVMLLLGWGLFFYGLRSELHPKGLHFGDTVYYAGASLFTIGYGDIVPTSAPARILSIICAASGLGVVAVVISFLFAIFGSFQRRESFVVTIGARAGVPPSGVGLLVVHADIGLRADLALILREGQKWTAEVMESHLAYPILVYFRSSHDYESWVGTLGALMDASSLILSTLHPDRMVNPQTYGQAQIMYQLGKHLTHDFGDYFRLDDADSWVGVDRTEFEATCDHLQECGYELIDRDAAWARFSELRAVYAARLNAMARWLQIPPVQWVSDRSMLSVHTGHGV